MHNKFLIFYKGIKSAREFEYGEIRYLVVVMSGEIVVLCLRHTHLILQHLYHRVNTLTIAIHSHLIYILGKTVVVALFAVVSLVVQLVVHCIRVLRLQVFQRVLVCNARIVGINLGLANLGSLLKPVEDRYSKGNTETIGVIPMIALSRMEPVLKLICLCRESEVASEGNSRQIGILGQFHLLFSEFLLGAHELQFI